jgi:hypothetical protein
MIAPGSIEMESAMPSIAPGTLPPNFIKQGFELADASALSLSQSALQHLELYGLPGGPRAKWPVSCMRYPASERCMTKVQDSSKQKKITQPSRLGSQISSTASGGPMAMSAVDESKPQLHHPPETLYGTVQTWCTSFLYDLAAWDQITPTVLARAGYSCRTTYVLGRDGRVFLSVLVFLIFLWFCVGH